MSPTSNCNTRAVKESKRLKTKADGKSQYLRIPLELAQVATFSL